MVIFFSEKSCRHKMVVSTSFWSWLLNVSSVLTTKKYIDRFFGVVNVLMRCGHAGGSWEYYILILVFMILKFVIFCVCS